MNELNNVLDIEKGINREDLLYKNSDTIKNRVYDFRKCKTIQCFRLAISNGTTTLENTVDDQAYLKDAIHEFKKSTRIRLIEKINEKELTPNNANDRLIRRRYVITAFESGIFPAHAIA